MIRLASHPTCCLALFASLTAGSLQAQGLPPVPVPAGNPITADKANLGKVLFWEEQLSATKNVACATCHLPEAGGGDPRTMDAHHPGPDGTFGTNDDLRGSPGVINSNADGTYNRAEPFPLVAQVTGRKAPSVINAAYNPLQFWDGRATGTFRDPVSGQVVLGNRGSLESQAAEPPLSAVEMAHQGEDWVSLAAEITTAVPLALASDLPPALEAWIDQRDYPALFAEAFGDPAVTPARIAMAIATYQRTLISDQAPIDLGALTQQQQRGRQIFNGPARCDRCHGGPLQTDQSFQNIGVRPRNEDLGRGGITGNPRDNGAFKVPSLRNVSLRAPFFHNGSQDTLDGVIDFYARGGDFRQGQSPRIQPFQLQPQDRAALIAFVRDGLTDPRVAQGLPPFDHPTLFSLSSAVPSSYGNGSAGLGGQVARLVADEPPLLGNATFTMAVADARAGAPAFLLADVAPNPSGTGLLGVPLWLAATPSLALLPLGLLNGTGIGGHESVVLDLPTTPTLAGATVYWQALVLDAAAAGGLASTAGVATTLMAAR
ncbi:MAG: cytochrome c peroxidase [Planctomycetota bacterium]